MAGKHSAVLLAVVLAFAAWASAQEHRPADQPAPEGQKVSAEPQKTGQHGEASKEAAEEDETAAFKESPSVQFFARITGLSLSAAYWVSTIFNFAVVAGLILWGMKKALPGLFRDRSAMIRKAMDEARKASEEANRRLGDIEGRLTRLDQEIAALRSATEEEARKEEERIRAAAEEDRQKVVQSAEQEIAAAARSARHELKAYAAELAVSLAGKKIQVKPEEDRELVRSFSGRLGKDGR